MRNRATSLLILLILSLIPFCLVMRIWFTIPSDIELGGLYYIFGISSLFLPALAFVLITYRVLSRRLKLTVLPTLVVIIVPVVINLISTQWYFIRVGISRAQYFNKYKGLNLSVELVEGRLVPQTQQVYNFAAEYRYKLLLDNPSDKTFNDVELWVSLSYKYMENERQDLGSKLLRVDIGPGENTLEGELLLDSYELRCRYKKAQTPLRIVVGQKILERETTFQIPLDQSLKDDLLIIDANLEEMNKGAPFPLRTCLDRP